SGRRSRVVLTPRRWCQVCEKERRRRWPKGPEHRGDHGVAVKTIAWGMPGDSGVTCMLVCALPLPLHTRPRAHRPPGIPCALNSERAGINEYLAKKAFGEIAKLCLNVIASAAKQSIFPLAALWIASLTLAMTDCLKIESVGWAKARSLRRAHHVGVNKDGGLASLSPPYAACLKIESRSSSPVNARRPRPRRRRR